MTISDDLPKADAVLDANDVVKFGTVALAHCLADRWCPYHDLAGIVYEAEDFYQTSHSIVMRCWKRVSVGDRITMEDLLDALLDVEEYDLTKTTKHRKSRGPGMKEDREAYGYGTSTKAALYSALYDLQSPGTTETLGKYLKTLSKKWMRNSTQG